MIQNLDTPDSPATQPSGCDKLPGSLRWTSLLARSAHLAAVVVLGAAVLGAPIGTSGAAVAALVSGLVMLAIDIWWRPGHLRELAGATMLAKIALVAWMVADEELRAVLFWLLLGVSGVVAHAPAYFRHARIVGRARRVPS